MYTSLLIVTTCEKNTAPQEERYTNTKIHSNPNWLSAETQARIDPPPIPLTKAETEEEIERNIIKVKMRRNLSSDTSETYELKMDTFDNGQP